MDEIKSPESSIESTDQKSLSSSEKNGEKKVDELETTKNTPENIMDIDVDRAAEQETTENSADETEESKNAPENVGEVDAGSETPEPNEAAMENPEDGTYRVDPEQETSRVEGLGFKTENIDGDQYLCRENGDIVMSMDEHMALRESSVHNADSDTLVLGKYHEEGSPDADKSYDKIAEAEGKSYFQMEKGAFDDLKEAGLSDSEIYDLYNKPAIEEAIEDGKTIEFTGDPKEMSTVSGDGELNYSGREYWDIQQYADEKGDNMVLDKNSSGRYEASFINPYD